MTPLFSGYGEAILLQIKNLINIIFEDFPQHNFLLTIVRKKAKEFYNELRKDFSTKWNNKYTGNNIKDRLIDRSQGKALVETFVVFIRK